MNPPIVPMQIGIPSCLVGFTVIQGPSIARNALAMFQASQALPPEATLTDAYRLAQTQAEGLRKLPALNPKIQNMFQEIHEWICCGVEEPPVDLNTAYRDFQRHPSLAGIARYFDLMAGLIQQEARPRRS